METNFPIGAGFLGSKAEHGRTWSEILNYILQDYIYWRRNYFPEDEQILDRGTRREHEVWFDVLSNQLDKVLNELKADYPFYSPRYHGHMVSENLISGVIGYFAGMLYNPNNVSSESAPITLNLEMESGRMISKMLGYDPSQSWAHITSGGTIANLEAMWAARQNQLNAVAFQDVCQRHQIAFEISLPNGHKEDIRKVDQRTLIGLKPTTQVLMPDLFRLHIHNEQRGNISQLMQEAKYGPYSITHNGLHEVYHKLGIEPLIFASQAAHYSIRKTANLLGLGEKHVHFLPVDNHFRLNTHALQEAISGMKRQQLILATIGILGTTEEGAIDPLDQLMQIRAHEEKVNNRSYWVHADAAWGGYLKTLDLNDPCLSAHARRALKALPEADSITIDPHKMGFIPYPSGVIAFKYKHAVLHSHQVAPYITLNHETPNPLDANEVTESVGPYIIEGSKPGAAAVATWLTHKTIPLDPTGHGKIIKSSLENAQRFYTYMDHHKNQSEHVELVPINQPDCNVLCYYFRIKNNDDLALQNVLNKQVYKGFSLGKTGGKWEMPYRKEYFISHTHFFPSHYTFNSVDHLLADVPDAERAYAENGFFILRSVILNPWLDAAREKNTDHLEMLIRKLYEVAEEELEILRDQMQTALA